MLTNPGMLMDNAFLLLVGRFMLVAVGLGVFFVVSAHLVSWLLAGFDSSR